LRYIKDVLAKPMQALQKACPEPQRLPLTSHELQDSTIQGMLLESIAVLVSEGGGEAGVDGCAAIRSPAGAVPCCGYIEHGGTGTHWY